MVMRDGEPWWFAYEVCGILGINNSRMASARLSREETNTVSLADGKRGNPNRTIISESGLYKLILRSDKPEARAFQDWVTREVLPSIRRAGETSRTRLIRVVAELVRFLPLVRMASRSSAEVMGWLA